MSLRWEGKFAQQRSYAFGKCPAAHTGARACSRGPTRLRHHRSSQRDSARRALFYRTLAPASRQQSRVVDDRLSPGGICFELRSAGGSCEDDAAQAGTVGGALACARTPGAQKSATPQLVCAQSGWRFNADAFTAIQRSQVPGACGYPTYTLRSSAPCTVVGTACAFRR